MGVLDSVFAGENGVSALLHGMLGGTATVRVVTGHARDEVGIVTTQYTDYNVQFVPAEINDEKSSEAAPGTGRSDVRLPLNEIAGSFPCSDVAEQIVSERDSIIVNGVQYLITAISTLKVGDADVQYSIHGQRC